jgi:hypothetical protein
MNLINQKNLEGQIKSICGNWWTSIKINEIEIIEKISSSETHIKCDVIFDHKSRNKKVIKIATSGKGVVDALFKELSKQLEEKYSSLSQIKFKDFFIKANIKTSLKGPGSDAPVEACLKINNSRGQEFEFSSKAISVNMAAVKVVINTIEFFVNSHIAVSKIYFALKDAQDRRREDLVEKYTLQLGEIVKVTSYEDVINKIKNNGDKKTR